MKIQIRFYYDLGTSTTLLLAVSTTIRVIFIKISNLSAIAVQWNGGLTGLMPRIIQHFPIKFLVNLIPNCVIYVLCLSCFRVCSLLPCGHLLGKG